MNESYPLIEKTLCSENEYVINSIIKEKNEMDLDSNA